MIKKTYIVLLAGMLLVQSQAVLANTSYENTEAQRVGTLYGVVMPRIYHTAMECYLDATLESMTRYVAKKYKKEYVHKTLPSICTEVEILRTNDVTISTEHLVANVARLMGNEGTPGLVEENLAQSSAALTSGELSEHIPLEAELYEKILLPEMQGYRDFLFVDQSILSGVEKDALLARARKGDAIQDAIVFPSTVDTELRMARSLIEAQRKVIAEYHRALTIHYELLLLKERVTELIAVNKSISMAIETLAEKLPAVLPK